MRFWFAILAMLFVAGCKTTDMTVKDKEVVLTDRVFEVQEYDPAPDIFRTSDIEYLCIGSWTAITNGTIMDIHAGIRVRYSADSFESLHTVDGFTIFTYYPYELAVLPLKKPSLLQRFFRIFHR